MDNWLSLIIADYDVIPELIVLVRLIGVCYMLEIVTAAIGFINGIRR